MEWAAPILIKFSRYGNDLKLQKGRAGVFRNSEQRDHVLLNLANADLFSYPCLQRLRVQYKHWLNWYGWEHQFTTPCPSKTILQSIRPLTRKRRLFAISSSQDLRRRDQQNSNYSEYDRGWYLAEESRLLGLLARGYQWISASHHWWTGTNNSKQLYWELAHEPRSQTERNNVSTIQRRHLFSDPVRLISDGTPICQHWNLCDALAWGPLYEEHKRISDQIYGSWKVVWE